MGIEIEVSTLEEMCDLMCDNVIPKKKPEKGEEEKDDKRGVQAVRTCT